MFSLEHHKNPSKIIGIQCSILSPEEIRNNSVAEITSRDTFVNNIPKTNGLFDARMGVLEPGMICPTDGLDYMKTPGYFGHINLARPVFYYQYSDTVTKILRCICTRCSKLLICKNKYKHLLNLKAEERWDAVFSLASKIESCGKDTSDGCGWVQPTKIKKEGLATIIADWTSKSQVDKKKIKKVYTAFDVLQLFRMMTDEDISFMGFSPTWSRPEWMICQTLAVPPPAVRPSVKQDSQQRSEDDITVMLMNIIKTNNTLHEKIATNAPINIINDYVMLLQFYVTSMVNNNISDVSQVAQRSGRPFKSLQERLNGKTGRVRGNLMGKRVDFSARSVITPDPNISLVELGVPMKIAMNLTKPIVVNDKNKKFLHKLVLNGPDVHPGAKIYEKKNGENISLRFVDRKSIVLENGDIVHRHMMDGDPVLFNRQPSLHRMSMMCHIAKIMPVGDTFRMHLSPTAAYNADFDKHF